MLRGEHVDTVTVYMRRAGIPVGDDRNRRPPASLDQ
jgi:hypothetical protein